MGRAAAVLVAAVAACGIGLGACGALVGAAAGIGGPAAAPAPTGGGGAHTRTPAVPAAWEVLDRAAAATCPGLDWTLLAAIGRVESDSGRSTAPGVWSGANPAGAEGPMQFEPATFASYDEPVPPGGAVPPSPYDPVDAVYAAARMLCTDGAGKPSRLYGAVWDYDHSPTYVETVLVLAAALGTDPELGTVPASALGFAAEQLGVPYLWGGTGQGGFDCSGLVQAAYRAAGVQLPRVAQTQFDAGPRVPPGAPLVPGDLLFFGASVADVTHVGLYLGDGEMIDAPHSGAVVRVDRTPTAPGATWGGDRVVGATRPAE